MAKLKEDISKQRILCGKQNEKFEKTSMQRPLKRVRPEEYGIENVANLCKIVEGSSYNH